MRIQLTLACLAAAPFAVHAQEPAAAPTQLTIYNNSFAVARTTVPLNLHTGINEVTTSSVTSQLEPDSVVLRDPATHNPIPVLEQSYDAGVVNQAWLLQKYEGKTIDFQTQQTRTIEAPNSEVKMLPPTIVQGRIIRAGSDPLIEVNGKMQFKLPGTPLFPVETDNLILKPTLRWQIDARKAGSIAAELGYITRGLKWQATYNVIVPETSDTTATEQADLLGWVTIDNTSGTDFPQANIQLMAGDVAKIEQPQVRNRLMAMSAKVAIAPAPEVTQKDFDEFHLYDLHRTVSLPNKETKQVQFIEAGGVTVQRTYEFAGTDAAQGFYAGFHNEDASYNSPSPTHVTVREEFKNSAANHLGMPLPAGRLRLYRREEGQQGQSSLQFVGESMIPHTPAEQQVEFVTGRAFDVTATQRQTDFHTDSHGRTMDESFEVKLSNQKAQPVTVHVVEHMNRSENWKITAKSSDYSKRDSSTIDFPVTIAAKSEATLTYSAHYTW